MANTAMKAHYQRAKAGGNRSKEHHLGILDGVTALSPLSSWQGAGHGAAHTADLSEHSASSGLPRNLRVWLQQQ